jgi:hypothetical protein
MKPKNKIIFHFKNIILYYIILYYINKKLLAILHGTLQRFVHLMSYWFELISQDLCTYLSAQSTLKPLDPRVHAHPTTLCLSWIAWMTLEN